MNKRCSICCRFADAYAGKKAKLQDAALLNRAGKFMRYSKADWTFSGINITTPPGNSSAWAGFNITDLPGPKIYPVSTVSLIFASQEMVESGEPFGRRSFTGAMCAAPLQADVGLPKCS